MLKRWKRGLAALMVTAMALTMSLPALAADPLASGGFAEVLISAGDTDFPETTLTLAIYQRDGGGAFQKVDTLDFTTPVNRVTKDMEFHLTPQAQQVTLSVDYLTDLDQDGVYELLSGQDTPAGDRLTAAGSLAAATSGVSSALTPERTYTITAQNLLARGRAAIQDRTTSGSAGYLGLSAASDDPYDILYMVTVTYHSDGDQRDYELCYYLRLFDQLPAPSAADYRDIPKNAWYYDAADYVLSKGLLSGSSRSLFSPNQPLTRAMLAQTLHKLAGQPDGAMSHFTDVPEDAWSYAAVSWAVDAGVMSGTSSALFAPDRTLSRQELALTLFRYAQSQGVNTKEHSELSVYSDGDAVAPWAREAVSWAVARGLLTPSGQKLDPASAVTRAQFSAVLMTLCESVLPKA